MPSRSALRLLFPLAILLVAQAAAPRGTLADDTLVISPIAVESGDTPAGGRYILFGDISLDNLRRVTFTASTTFGKNGVFRSERGGVKQLLLMGDDAPDDAGTTFLSFFEAASNRRGDLAFIASTLEPHRDGVFLMSGGVVRTVALAGSPAPTPHDTIMTGFDQIYLLDSGDLLFGAQIEDAVFGPTRAILKYTTSGLQSVVAPGDRVGFLGLITGAFQFEANQSGDVAVLAVVGEFNPGIQLVGGTPAIELYSNGTLTPVAAVGGAVNHLDRIATFALSLDEVNLNEAGAVSFFATSVFFPLGGYYVNRDATVPDIATLLKQTDPSPLSDRDRFQAVGAFGFNSSDTLVFHATTAALPAGGLFVRRKGVTSLVARVGDPRPDGTDSWHGFLRVDLNESDAFAFTDNPGLFNTGIFLGRFLLPPDQILDSMRSAIVAAALGGVQEGLLARVDVLDLSLSRGEVEKTLRQAESFATELAARAGHSVPQSLVDLLDLDLEDLVAALESSPPAP